MKTMFFKKNIEEIYYKQEYKFPEGNYSLLEMSFGPFVVAKPAAKSRRNRGINLNQHQAPGPYFKTVLREIAPSEFISYVLNQPKRLSTITGLKVSGIELTAEDIKSIYEKCSYISKFNIVPKNDPELLNIASFVAQEGKNVTVTIASDKLKDIYDNLLQAQDPSSSGILDLSNLRGDNIELAKALDKYLRLIPWIKEVELPHVDPQMSLQGILLTLYHHKDKIKGWNKLCLASGIKFAKNKVIIKNVLSIADRNVDALNKCFEYFNKQNIDFSKVIELTIDTSYNADITEEVKRLESLSKQKNIKITLQFSIVCSKTHSIQDQLNYHKKRADAYKAAGIRIYDFNNILLGSDISEEDLSKAFRLYDGVREYVTPKNIPTVPPAPSIELPKKSPAGGPDTPIVGNPTLSRKIEIIDAIKPNEIQKGIGVLRQDDKGLEYRASKLRILLYTAMYAGVALLVHSFQFSKIVEVATNIVIDALLNALANKTLLQKESYNMISSDNRFAFCNILLPQVKVEIYRDRVSQNIDSNIIEIQ